MATGFKEFKSTSVYDSSLAGAIVGCMLINARDPRQVIAGLSSEDLNKKRNGVDGISGITISRSIEEIPIESIGSRIASEIVSGRFSANVSINGFWTSRKSDEFLPSSSTFDHLQWHIIKFITEDITINSNVVKAGTVIEAIRWFSIASYTSPNGARGALTFDLSGPCIEVWNATEANTRLGLL